MTDLHNVTATCQALMRAVVNSGCIRSERDTDITLAIVVMREELKAFIDTDNAKYADERAITLSGSDGLAMASITAECIRRILAEREA